MKAKPPYFKDESHLAKYPDPYDYEDKGNIKYEIAAIVASCFICVIIGVGLLIVCGVMML